MKNRQRILLINANNTNTSFALANEKRIVRTVKVATAVATQESGKAEADRTRRINVAAANAAAIQGENNAIVNIANSTSDMKQKRAEADRAATAAENVKAAQALAESYKAQEIAEMARAERERATRTANVVVEADINRQKGISINQ